VNVSAQRKTFTAHLVAQLHHLQLDPGSDG
jgi:hypothetical protein